MFLFFTLHIESIWTGVKARISLSPHFGFLIDAVMMWHRMDGQHVLYKALYNTKQSIFEGLGCTHILNNQPSTNKRYYEHEQTRPQSFRVLPKAQYKDRTNRRRANENPSSLHATRMFYSPSRGLVHLKGTKFPESIAKRVWVVGDIVGAIAGAYRFTMVSIAGLEGSAGFRGEDPSYTLSHHTQPRPARHRD
jgi:hypothetical protein